MRAVSKDQNDPDRYDDMLNLPHHQSGTRKHMTPDQRAAQFSPFAALTGYEEAIQESSRLTMHRIELSDEEKEILNRKLQILSLHAKEKPNVTVTWFEEDPYKEGGSYVQKTVRISKIDTTTGNLITTDRKTIPLQEIVALESSLFDECIQ